VHIPIFTGLSDARNAVNVNSCDVVVCHPGGEGTLSEIALALKRGKPVVLIGWSELRLPSDCSTLRIRRAAADAREAAELVRGILQPH
jgi:uncharacterized protein (TIGR00725 family)